MDPMAQIQESSQALADATEQIRRDILAALNAHDATAGLDDSLKLQIAGNGAQVALMVANTPVIVPTGQEPAESNGETP